MNSKELVKLSEHVREQAGWVQQGERWHNADERLWKYGKEPPDFIDPRNLVFLMDAADKIFQGDWWLKSQYTNAGRTYIVQVKLRDEWIHVYAFHINRAILLALDKWMKGQLHGDEQKLLDGFTDESRTMGKGEFPGHV